MLDINITKKLNNFTLNIECKLDSNRIGILGGSGAGKSMILKMLAGIEKPDSGYIKLDDTLLFDSNKASRQTYRVLFSKLCSLSTPERI